MSCNREARSRREQRAKSGAEGKAQGGAEGPGWVSPESEDLEPRREQAKRDNKQGGFTMKAIVTVIGRDQVGIIAAVCALLSEKNINVLDISQTVLQEYFTMIMLVDASQATVKLCSEDTRSGRLTEAGAVGAELGAVTVKFAPVT